MVRVMHRISSYPCEFSRVYKNGNIKIPLHVQEVALKADHEHILSKRPTR